MTPVAVHDATSSPTNPELLQVALQPGLQPVVVTLTGRDRPGVTAAFFRVLSAHGVQLLDVEQSQFRGYLSLAAYVGVEADRLERMREGLTDTLKGHGQTVTVERVEGVPHSRSRSTHVIVVLGAPVNANDVSAIGQTLANYGANIDRIRGIADYPITGLELAVTVADAEPGGGKPLRKALAALTTELGVDIAI